MAFVKRSILLLLLYILIIPANAQKSTTSLRNSAQSQAAQFNDTAKNKLAPNYPYLAQFIIDRFKLQSKTGIGLDIGGGPGDLTVELCKRTSSMYWIVADINPWYADYFYQRVKKNNLFDRAAFIQADVHSLPFRDNYADVVVSRGSVQFWQDKEKAFSEIIRVLKPGGAAIIGRGFSENLPLGIAHQIRAKQGGKMPSYNPAETAHELEIILQKLNVTDYEIQLPREDQKEVSYGFWILFKKP
jgi:ubiquinone/menaquinone biosynthesis C-methylase UbiE